MLIQNAVLQRIRAGSVSLAFRRWRRPSVRSGGTLLTAIGRLQIASVSTTPEDAITEQDAVNAGHASLAELLHTLNQRAEGDIYRIEFGGIAPDERVTLREAVPDASEAEAIFEQLERLDDRAAGGPWTGRVLELIAAEPGVLAELLSQRMGMDKAAFKANVRKLKSLGLTISLETGYRLSARGESVLAAQRAGPGPQGDSCPSP